MLRLMLSSTALAVLLAVPASVEPVLRTVPGSVPSERAIELASRTRRQAAAAVEQTLAALVAFDTFHREGIENAQHPSFIAQTRWLADFASEAGLDFADHGAVVVIGLGDATERLGLLTHGDVQPADASKWAASPFALDGTSEPGRLIGRGVQDDKGPIACVLHAMQALAQSGYPLRKRVELTISYTEESDWEPFEDFLARHPPPPLNVAFDAEYPVVVGEKGWCLVKLSLPLLPPPAQGPGVAAFTGGFFVSQVPEDAEARLTGLSPEDERALREAAARRQGQEAAVRFSFERSGDECVLRAAGRSAHSSTPEQGRNAITHLAALLASRRWEAGGAAAMVALIDELVGTGFHGEAFGELAYSHPFMGPLTLSLGTLRVADGQLVASINLRRPAGRDAAQVEESLRQAVAAWAAAHPGPDGAPLEVGLEITLGEPHLVLDAPHVPTLLATFRHYTGQSAAEPIAIGGGTHARLVPAGVNFGPGMPGVPYTGHSEHESTSREQLLLDLAMVTSLLVDLAVEP